MYKDSHSKNEIIAEVKAWMCNYISHETTDVMP